MQSICAVEGVTATGIKEGKFGLALIRAEGTAAAAFTKNIARAAPIIMMQERIKKGRLGATITNSGCANALTGQRGITDAEEMAAIAANELSLDPLEVGVASTGVISRYLNIPLIRDQCHRIAPLLDHNPAAEIAAAKAIMTTDLVEKHALVKREGFTIGGICKGSGMIAPNMGTMLGYVYTDAEISAPDLQEALKTAVRRSFNRVVVDGDTSTNDVVFCTATGSAGKVPLAEFTTALEQCCVSLGRKIACDGEGATKLIEVIVRGARSEDEADLVARTVVSSPLVKTAIYGEDPNWGRIVAAAGRSGAEFDPEQVSCWISGSGLKAAVCEQGILSEDLKTAKAALGSREVQIELDLAAGDGKAVAWGCDLTEKYVEINGKYTT
ncbi:MAG: bifunctional glutamate N-acetyltransferase/amino-acid acetyltransferase ArgJ [Methanospirillum sp.]|uniref:bifunctional glutamate N-acetyltransferase/amino-acid acetyltransferase ArgJ n=1 Tax=Methanospirillum sp. TaxID=45200 RepID=UPI0023723D61|nr:bifunctional glutamate N-acetyltransferase/amino-acid acetyltransferase ArgJ [Methanospirillum sp.]MDD1729575.1 bifunctional glutamate N-acetyltransferase/amino-acid acetyltransferase ArgJ [Methanospirillum sp.]